MGFRLGRLESAIVAGLIAVVPARAADDANLVAPGVTASDLSIKGPAVAGAAHTITPNSSLEQPADFGQRAHTNYLFVVPPGAQSYATTQATTTNAGAPPYPGYYYETPASLACIYKLVAQTNGCDPNKVTAVATGGSKAIALVLWYDNPYAATDLAYFSKQFGLPAPNFTKVYASGTQPPYNMDAATEEDLDIQMAHSMAPSAKLYLVEAATPSNADLQVALAKAYQLVVAAGGGEISMSYGQAEYAGETSYDTIFNKAGNVVFFASTGDAPGTEYPSVSPHVVAVGGTSTSRQMVAAATKGAFLEETAWSETGGGISTYFPRPTFQSAIASRFSPAITKRTAPDVSAVASDLTPVWLRFNGAWYTVAGTSVASPLTAGMANHWSTAKKLFRANSAAELAYIYSQIGNAASYYDVSLGVCGPQAGFFASARTSTNKVFAYDLCTGIGSPRGATAF